MNKQVVIHNQTIPITYTSSIQSIPYQNIVWGRKRSQVQMSGEEILKKEDSLSQDITKMNQMILLCGKEFMYTLWYRWFVKDVWWISMIITIFTTRYFQQHVY